MALLEKTEQQKKFYEDKCQEMEARLKESEETLTSLQTEMAKYQVSGAHHLAATLSPPA